MPRIYARREDNGERILVAIQCDKCDAEIEPHPGIARSGWEQVQGAYYSPGDSRNTGRLYYCPDHS